MNVTQQPINGQRAASEVFGASPHANQWPPGVWTLEFITPDLAQQHLEGQHNRKLRDLRVAKIAGMILSGDFELTHQGIALDSDGRLKDGQHRLHAIIKAGVGVWLWVYRGLSKKAVSHIDTHAPRSDADAANLEGWAERVSNSFMAVARIMFVGFKPGRIDVMNRAETLRFAQKHSEAIQFAMAGTGSPTFRHASVRGAIARAFYTQDHEKLDRFKYVLTTGNYDDESEIAAIRLRRFMLKSPTGQGGDHQRKILYKKVVPVLGAFLDGRSVGQIREGMQELFLLPEENPTT